MSLHPGDRLGGFEILGPLGAGGMGEVYRARDTRLRREVALKVLPDSVAADPVRLARFEKEARSASALNHPNIVTVYEVGRSDETIFLAMELVDGSALRDLVAEGPLPLRRILNVVAQTAEGLAAAHARGIVHRDLKPENLMVSRDGVVKILDFGLAKTSLLAARPEEQTLGEGEVGTAPGTVLGTVGYMSPEQASGRGVDFRSDQFALGTILYEMLSGKRAFKRTTPAETLAAIIREEPESVVKLRPELPPPLRWILERCLAKDPEERYASTRDLARDLASVRDHISEVSSGGAVAAEALGKRRRAISLAGALALAAAALAAGWGIAREVARRAPAAPPSFQRLTFRLGQLGNARFSPDGNTVVYGAAWNKAGPMRSQLYLTRPESPESKGFDLEGDTDLLSISKAGELAVLQERNELGMDSGTLAVLPLTGGVPRRLVEGVRWAGADWSPDGAGLAVARRVGGKDRLEFPVGRVIVPDGAERPRFSPDGRSISYWQAMGGSEGVAVVDRDGKSKRILSGPWVESQGLPCWRPDGKEIWFTARRAPDPAGLWAVDLSGKVRQVTRWPGDLELYDIASDGRVLLAHHAFHAVIRGLAPDAAAERELSWLDVSYPADLSPDGETLLLAEVGEGAGKTPAVYLRGTDGSPAVRIGEGRPVALSPDKAFVLAKADGPDGAMTRLVLLPTGPGTTRELARGVFSRSWGAFSPDGKLVFYSENRTGPDNRVYIQDLAGGPRRELGPPNLRLQFYTSPLSPDGARLVAFLGERAVLVPVEGGAEPREIPLISRGERVIQWSADSKLVFVYDGASRPLRVWRVDVESGRRTLWKDIAVEESMTRVLVRITPDGKAYVYGGTNVASALYLVKGLR